MAESSSHPGNNPFLPEEADRDALRRLRGRLTAPVTIVTAGNESGRVGLTVSSVFVAEGEPPLLYFLLGATSDLYYAIEETGRFVAHVCEGRHRELADVFAGLRPSPGGMFVDRHVTQDPYGPVFDGIGTRAYCSYERGEEDSYSVLVKATVDRIEVGDVDDPLAYFRGRYRTLD
jgi:flavin reductase (DIM6/NTAB) family NADH-FMN oxidoreductase RutF